MPEMGRSIGSRLCEAWGIDPSNVGRITITIDASSVVTAELMIYTKPGDWTEELIRLQPVEDAHRDGGIADA